MPSEQGLIHIINGCIVSNRVSQNLFYEKFYGFSIAICMRYCSHKEDAIEVVNDDGGTGFTYSLNGNPYQASNIFNSLAAVIIP